GWRYQMPALAKAGFRVVAPDQRGYGVSGKPRGVASYDLDELADDVIALGAYLGETQLRVVGHDWGASIAWWPCSARAEHIDKAAMINAPHPAIWKRAMHSDRGQSGDDKCASSSDLETGDALRPGATKTEPLCQANEDACSTGNGNP